MSVVERYLAIDNVCAWPILARLPDGRVSVVIFNEPTHGGWEGELACWVSGDEGRTWSHAGVPVPHVPGIARMNHAAGVAGNGDLIAIVGGHDNRPPRGQPNPDLSKSSPVHPVAVRSADGGRTWRPCAPIPRATDGRELYPFGPVVRRQDGTLFASFYDWPTAPAEPGNKGSALLYRSDDDGHSWRRHALIAPDDYNETCLLFVNDKRCLAAARTYNNQTVHLYISDDGGDSWRFHAPVTGAYEHNAHLMALPDGRILLTYGVRHPHDLALECRVSPDGGETWRRPHRLFQIDDRERYDGGYPSCLAVGEDLVLTAYYTRRSPWHHRYHMGVFLWNWRNEFDQGFDR